MANQLHSCSKFLIILSVLFSIDANKNSINFLPHIENQLLKRRLDSPKSRSSGSRIKLRLKRTTRQDRHIQQIRKAKRERVTKIRADEREKEESNSFWEEGATRAYMDAISFPLPPLTTTSTAVAIGATTQRTGTGDPASTEVPVVPVTITQATTLSPITAPGGTGSRPTINDAPTLSTTSQGTTHAPSSFDMSQCSSYGLRWLIDLHDTCKDSQTWEGCECIQAQELYSAGEITCGKEGDPSPPVCPPSCEICKVCLILVGCENIYNVTGIEGYDGIRPSS